MEELKLTDNPAHHRFEVDLGDGIAFVEYASFKNDIVLIHTFVPENHRGQGIAGKMFKQVLEYVKAMKIPLIVYCPTVSKYIESHPEYIELLDEKYVK